MDYYIRKIQHFSVQNWKRLNTLYKLKWVQIATLAIVLIVVLKKNVNVSVNLFSPKTTTVQPQTKTVAEESIEMTPATEAEKTVVSKEEKQKETEKKVIEAERFSNSIFSEEPAHLLRNMPTAADANIANTYSNLGFILNPQLAIRLKVSPRVVAIKKKKCRDYIERFSPIAVEEMKKYGVPASITLAQGLLESNVGDSKLAVRNNNHFGIKCFSTNCVKGHCSNYTDDSHKDFFRIYKSDWESYRAHSKFLQRPRYKHLKKYGSKDYQKWAHGLKKAGYATDKKYAYKLIDIVKKLNLDRFDV
jgi:flagellum-specific peptidoglycan hydrolase FlgJ